MTASSLLHKARVLPTDTDEQRIDELGELFASDDGDVLQEFFLALCEGRLAFPPIAAPTSCRCSQEVR